MLWATTELALMVSPAAAGETICTVRVQILLSAWKMFPICYTLYPDSQSYLFLRILIIINPMIQIRLCFVCFWFTPSSVHGLLILFTVIPPKWMQETI